MTLQLPTLKKIIFILLFGIITFSCSDPKDSFPDELLPRSPEGEYKITSVQMDTRMVTPTTDTPYSITLTTKCDLLSSKIKFNSNDTFELMDYNYNNETNYNIDLKCTAFEKVTGKWIRTSTSGAGSYGYLTFDTTFRGYTITEATYTNDTKQGKRVVRIILHMLEEGQKSFYTILFVES